MHTVARARLDQFALRAVASLHKVRLPVSARSAPALILRSTSLGDFTVLIPFLATVAAEDAETRLLLLSRMGNVGTAILPHWNARISVIDPTTLASTIAGVRAAEHSFRGVEFGRVLYARHAADEPFGKLSRLIVGRVVGGFRASLVGFAPQPFIRSRAGMEAEPDVLALSQSLAPFVACGIRPTATRDDCTALLGFTAREYDDAAGVLRRLGADAAGPAIAMYVHAKDERKQWPLDRFIEVANALSRGSGRQIWLVGGPDDVAAARAVADALPRNRAIVLAGITDVRTTLTLLDRCDLFVGNDGSAMHFAALRGCPCVTVFCNWEPPGIWEPIAAPASRSLRPAWSAARTHGDFGIATIPAAAVLDAVADLSERVSGHEIQTFLANGTSHSTVHLEPLFNGPLPEPRPARH